MVNRYSENVMVRDGAIKLLHDELGWDTVYAFDQETFGPTGTLGRTSRREVILWRYLKEALKELNPWINDSQIEEARRKLESHLSTESLLQINEEKYFYIRDGIPVTVKRPDGTEETKKAQVINFNEPTNNRFLAVSELKIEGDIYNKRTDIIGFVNGLPLLFVELKRDDVDVEVAYTDNYSDYLDTIPHIFYYNSFLMFSNGMQAKVGTLGSKYRFFHEWKRLSEDEETGSVELTTMLRGICKKENFLDLLENFILFDHSNGRTVKIMAQNHQYLGVNAVIEAYEDRELREGKLGVFWHTQGSGKSYSMVFIAQKIKRKFTGSPTIVILTDREELNKQISGTFQACGLLGKAKGSQFIAKNGADLVKRLKANPSYIFTLIQKFNQPQEAAIHTAHEILVMSDEAHRSQNGVFADNMVKLLPDALKLGFTGTPLMSANEITARTFGGYVSVYDFKRAVDDKATVPLIYENRSDKIEDLKNPEINQQILDAIEAADIDEKQQEKLEHEFEKEIHILMAEPRLRAVAKDVVRHYTEKWETGKAMVVCLNKVSCVMMYNYVQEYWKDEIEKLEHAVDNATSDQDQQELLTKLTWMKETEMCVVVSSEQNEIKTFKKWKLDIKPHREKMVKRHLDDEFKDDDNPFRIVFVCAMWLTGFDVQSLSCLYLDKPLKAHTLMQTIARANRVADGKVNGLIIDYIGIVKALEKALNDFTQNRNGKKTTPTIEKEELIGHIVKALAEAENILNEHDFRLDDLIRAEYLDKLPLIRDGANAACGDRQTRRRYSTCAAEISRLMKYLSRTDFTDDQLERIDAIGAIDRNLRAKRKHIDTTDLMVKINGIMNESITMYSPGEGIVPSRQFDLSQIDFELLAAEFSRTRHRNLLMKDLEELIQERLEKMVNTNSKRIDYYERYMKIIEEYNENQDAGMIEKTFTELMNLAKSMSEEQQRYVREGFTSDEELSIYDLLFSENLSRDDIKSIKKISIELLAKIKDKIAEMDHWTDKQETRDTVKVLIRNALWEHIPQSMFADRSEYERRIYEYVYTHYKEVA